MIATKKEMVAERKHEKESRWVEVKAIDDRKVENKERKVAIEEEKLIVFGEEAQAKKTEQECLIMVIRTHRVYVEPLRAQIIASRMGGSGSVGCSMFYAFRS